MDTTVLDDNLSIIKKRWSNIHQTLSHIDISHLTVETEKNTLVVNNIQLTSNYDRQAETQLQISRIPNDSDIAFVYGAGLGDTANFLLERPALKKLHIIILNSAIFLHVLNALEHEWLKDSRVTLHLIETIKEVYSPFCANPAELLLADDDSVQLRDLVSLELNHDYIQKQFTKEHKNTQADIINNLDFIGIDLDLSQFNIAVPEEVFIAAAGPTLEEHLSWLNKNKPFIICLDAALPTLIASGILPNIVIAIDKKVFHFFAELDPIQFSDVPLVYFPSVDKKLLNYWPGERYCSFSQTKMFQGIPELKEKTPLFSAGSVIHPAIDLAVFLKMKKIILLGADFSFSDTKSHAIAKGQAHSTISLASARHWLFDNNSNKVKTIANFKGYLRDLERYIKKHPDTAFFYGSQKSAKIEGTQLWNR
jgi:hypothetical protein